MAVCALLGIKAEVLRIDLERKMVDRFGNIMLSDTVDVDNLIVEDAKNPHNSAEVDYDLLIEDDVDNYSILRDQNRNNLHKSIKQEHATSLAQNTGTAETKNSNNNNNVAHVHVHTKQLVSEHADSSIDNRDDLKL